MGTEIMSVVADDATVGRRARRIRTRRMREQERRAAEVRRAHGRRAHGKLRFATGIVLIVALVAAAFGAEGFIKASRSQRRVATLQAELNSLQQRVVADEHGAASERRHVRTVAARASSAQKSVRHVSWLLQSVPSQAQLASVRNELAPYAACIPQLERELSGLGISWRIDPTKPSSDYFKLFTQAPMSASCGAALARR
jgi:cell division protein FtsB